jgi:hypothetical protein
MVLAACWSAVAGGAAALDCSAEAAMLAKDQSELPKIEVASPADRPPYCITLETIMAFASRVKAHVAHCPNSEHAAALADWDRTRSDYSKLFSQYRCRRTL